MIDGLKFSFTDDELRQHCKNRIEHYQKRIDVKQEELTAISNELSSESLPDKRRSKLRSKKDAIIKIIRQYAIAVKEFTVYVNHFADDDYLLDHHDLHAIEMISHRWD